MLFNFVLGYCVEISDFLLEKMLMWLVEEFVMLWLVKIVDGVVIFYISGEYVWEMSVLWVC